MKLIELIIDEEGDFRGIEAMSHVEYPAIEVDFVHFAAEQKIELKTNDEQKIVLGPALIPDKPIFRLSEEGEEFYIYFQKSTVKQAMELYMKDLNLHNATIEHENPLEGVYTVEAWIVEDPEKDKSALYGYNLPKGTWMISQKVENEDHWKKIKDGEIKGFSIEGYFADKAQLAHEKKILDGLKDIIG